MKYVTGYVLEKSLSVDNIFVIAMLFGFFAVPSIYQHRVLFWGVLGALVLRGVMIVVGAKLIAEFHWILYLFGAFLIVTGIKMLVMKTDHTDPNPNMVVRAAGGCSRSRRGFTASISWSAPGRQRRTRASCRVPGRWRMKLWTAPRRARSCSRLWAWRW